MRQTVQYQARQRHRERAEPNDGGRAVLLVGSATGYGMDDAHAAPHLEKGLLGALPGQLLCIMSSPGRTGLPSMGPGRASSHRHHPGTPTMKQVESGRDGLFRPEAR